MPNDYHKPTEEELRDILRPEDPKPTAPTPEPVTPTRVNVNLREDGVPQAGYTK